MPTLPNMGLITPTLGGDSGTWDDKINVCFGRVDDHDHTAGNGVQIPIAGLNIDDDLAMGGFFVTGVGKISFTAIATPSSGSKNLFVDSSDNELYWRTNGGANVKLTSGSSINTTLVGGIVGDYSSVGAEVAYDSSNKRYTFKDGSSPSKKWVRLASGPVRIFEHQTTESVYVELAAPAALGASYTITLPTALPGAGSALLEISAAGVVSCTNSASTPGFSDVYYAEQTLTLPASMATDTNGSHTRFTGGGAAQRGWTLAATANTIQWPIPVRHGDTIGTWTVYVDKNTNGSAEIEAQIFKVHGTDGTETAVGAGDADTTNAPNFITLTETVDEIVDAAYQYYLVFTPSTSVTPAADVVYHAKVGIYREAP